MSRASLKLAVLVSGNGSNLQTIIDASEQKKIVAQVAVVISNRKDVFALERAAKHHIPTFVVSNDTAKMEAEIAAHLQLYKIDLICLAGFMKILSPAFVTAWPMKIINIHPSLLPAFPGLNAAKQALEYGAKETGVTIHFVDEGCDTGPIILQEKVAIDKDDTESSLKKKIHLVEHELYPKAINLIANENLKIVEQRVLRK